MRKQSLLSTNEFHMTKYGNVVCLPRPDLMNFKFHEFLSHDESLHTKFGL